ncbi:MAG: NADH-quinone oxidoreductase subunit C [Deltaproteobacteria bacterium]
MPCLCDLLTDRFSAITKMAPSAHPSSVLLFSAPAGRLPELASALKAAGARLMAEWAVDETAFGLGFAVYLAFNSGKEHLLLKSDVPEQDPSFPSIAGIYPAANRFERQIMSLFGIIALGHPDPRPWIKHEDWPEDAFPLRKSFDASKFLERRDGTYDWIQATGDGVYEIPVGPVHAGIIEPGHFRFQAIGEDIINLEERLGYVHKGIEKRFESLPILEGYKLAGRVSGDTTVAHSIAYCQALEAAGESQIPPRAAWIRAVLLELERLVNHISDIGAICNDAAFTFMLYQTAILRERILKMNLTLFGHRLMMDCVIPGGVSVDITAALAILSELDFTSREFERLIVIYEGNPSLEDRLYGAGVLSPSIASELGVVGFVARASGAALDARLQMPFAPYDTIVPDAPLLTSGDVHARAWVRVLEVRESIRLIREFLRGLPHGPLSIDCRTPLSGASGFSTVEGWRGEIVYWLQAGHDGTINRCMVRDPSSVNWVALEHAVKGNIVPDFPLCNKSFNQSYSGNDL